MKSVLKKITGTIITILFVGAVGAIAGFLPLFLKNHGAPMWAIAGSVPVSVFTALCYFGAMTMKREGQTKPLVALLWRLFYNH